MNNIKVIIADDDINRNYFLKVAIEDLGFDVICTTNGIDTLKVIEDQYAIVIIDVNLPILNGLEVLKKIKKNRKFKKKTYIIVKSVLFNFNDVKKKYYPDSYFNGLVKIDDLIREIRNGENILRQRQIKYDRFSLFG